MDKQIYKQGGKKKKKDKEEENKKKKINESSLSSLQLTTENFQKSKVKIPEELEGVSSTETKTPLITSKTLSTVPIATFEPDSHVTSDTQILTKTTTPILSSSSHVMPVHHIRRGAGLRLSSFVKTLDVNEEEEKVKTVLDVDNCGMEEDKTKVERSKGNVFEKTQVLVDVSSSSSDSLLVQALSPVVSNHRGNSDGGGKEEEEDEFIVEFVDDSNVWGET
jgi:hypothetical protein